MIRSCIHFGVVFYIAACAEAAWAHGFMISEVDVGGVPASLTIASQSQVLDSTGTAAPYANLFWDKLPSATAADSLFTEGTSVSTPRSSPGTYYPTNDGGAQTAGAFGGAPLYNYAATFRVISPLLFSNGNGAVPVPAGVSLNIVERFPGNAPNGASNATNHPGAASTAAGLTTITGSTGNVTGFPISLADTHELAKDFSLGSLGQSGEYGFAYTVSVHYFLGSDLNHITQDGPTLTTGPLVDVFALTDPGVSGGNFTLAAPPTQAAATLDIYSKAVPEPSSVVATCRGDGGNRFARLALPRFKSSNRWEAKMMRHFRHLIFLVAAVGFAGRAEGHGFDIFVNYVGDTTPVSFSAFSQSAFLDQQQITAAPDNLFLGAFSSASSDASGTYFPVIHGFAETAGRWLPYTATYSVVSPLYFSAGSSTSAVPWTAQAVGAPGGTTLDIFNLWAGNPEPGVSPHPGATFGDAFVTGTSWSYVPADSAPFGVSLYDSHELEKDLYIGAGPTYGAYGFAYTLTAHFGDGSTLTTVPLVDVFALSDPTTGDFADTAPATIQDQSTFAIYRAIMRGDFNQDGKKTAADIPLMLSVLADLNEFKTANNLSDLGLLAIADVNQDGVITNADLQALLGLIAGGSQSPQGVPEPASILIAISAIVALLARQWQRRFGCG